jgi:hypothetical protein
MPGGKRPELPPPPRLLQVPGGLPGREAGIPPSQNSPAMHQSPVSPLHLHSRPKSPAPRESLVGMHLSFLHLLLRFTHLTPHKLWKRNANKVRRTFEYMNRVNCGYWTRANLYWGHRKKFHGWWEDRSQDFSFLPAVCQHSLIRKCQHVRFEVFTAVTMKNGVFWDVTPCGSCKNRRLGGT